MNYQKPILILLLFALSDSTYPSIQTTYNNNLNALTTDCAKLSYLLLNKIVNGQIIVQSILGYVIYENYVATNLACCNLGFEPANPNSFPYPVDISGLSLVNGIGRGANFSQAFLDRSRFDGSDLSPAQATDGCKVGHVTSFENSIVSQGAFISFVGTNLTMANISLVHWDNVIFKNTNLTNADLSQSDFHVILFSGTNLSGANFTQVRFRSAVCDPKNPPIVSSTTVLANGATIAQAMVQAAADAQSAGTATPTASGLFCQSFNDAYRVANVA